MTADSGAPSASRRAFLAVTGAVAAVIAVAGCGSWKPPVTPGVVKVVAGENFWGSIAAQIGGRHVQVTSILSSPAADPHLYESDVANAVAVAGAGLVIENGAGYDTFLSQLLGATTHPGRVVVSVQRVLGATGPDVNPHFWYDIPRVPRVAAAVEAALARLEPRDAHLFTANLARFDRSLGPVESVISRIRRRYLGAGRLHRAGTRLPAARRRAAGADTAGVRSRHRERQRSQRRRHPGHGPAADRPQGKGVAV
jgi:zinc/manganese transport system substrate-binding protein